MELWRFECRKLWKNKLVCGLILGCFFLNGIYLIKHSESYEEDIRCFPGTIKGVYEELQGVLEQDRIAWLNEELEQIESAICDLDGMEAAEWVYERRNALRHVLEHTEAVYGYDLYLERMEEQAKLITSSSLFGSGDLFSKRNAAMIPKKYNHLHGIKLKADNPQGILLATESKMTDLILAALAVGLAFFFFGMEREEGTMAFARCTRYGGMRQGAVKAAVVFSGSLLGALFLYGSNFAIAGAIYGFGDLGRWIQSVEGYTASPWKLSVGWYFVLFFLAKLAAAAVITGIVIWIVLWSKSILGTSLVLLGTAAVEYGFYASVPPHSWLDMLKQCNLFYLIETERFFKSYETINLFRYPVSSVLICAAAGAAMLALAVWAILFSYERVSRSEYTQKNVKKHASAGMKRRKIHAPLYYEAYKILWVSGAGVLLSGFLVMQFAAYSGEKAYFTLDELYYKNYMKKLEGEATEEKLDFIRAEGERIAGLEEELDGLIKKDGSMNEQEIQERRLTLERQLLCRSAFCQIEEQAKRIGMEGVFLNEVAYACLLDVRQQVNQAGKLLLVLLLAFHSAFIVEKTAGMQLIWNSIPNGNKKMQKQKWLLLTGSIVLLCVAADLIFIVFRMKAQGIVSLNEPIQYLPGFEKWKQLSVGGYLAGLCVLKMLLGIAACGGIERISKKAKNATTVLLAAGSAGGVCYLLLKLILLHR